MPQPRQQTVLVARFLDEVIERNIVIGQLYDIRDGLLEHTRVKQEPYLQRYRDEEFPTLFNKDIATTEGWLARDEAALLFDLARQMNRGTCIVERRQLPRPLHGGVGSRLESMAPTRRCSR